MQKWNWAVTVLLIWKDWTDLTFGDTEEEAHNNEIFVSHPLGSYVAATIIIKYSYLFLLSGRISSDEIISLIQEAADKNVL